MIGAYDEDVTYTVRNFLSTKLPESLFVMLDECLQDIYVEIDEEDNLREVVVLCNQYLEGTGYKLHLEFEDSYYAGAYFLSVVES